MRIFLTALLLMVGAIAVVPANRASAQEDEKKENGNGKEKDSKPRKVLLDWGLGQEPENGDEEEEEDTLPTDRPDFTENSRNVGLGRIQLECGYTYTQDKFGGVRTRSHSYPEVLVRTGLFAEWFEFRIGQNFASGVRHGLDRHGLADRFSASGAEDLYLGIALGLTEQKGIFPESRIMLQTTVPSGSEHFTARELLPGFNYCYGWDVIKDKITFAGNSKANRALDGSNHYYVEVAQSLTSGISISNKLGMYLEWYSTFPAGAIDSDTHPEHYFDSGFTYQFTPNFQIDIRAGVGLNRHADDFFAGSGFAVRY